MIAHVVYGASLTITAPPIQNPPHQLVILHPASLGTSYRVWHLNLLDHKAGNQLPREIAVVDSQQKLAGDPSEDIPQRFIILLNHLVAVASHPVVRRIEKE